MAGNVAILCEILWGELKTIHLYKELSVNISDLKIRPPSKRPQAVHPIKRTPAICILESLQK